MLPRNLFVDAIYHSLHAVAESKAWACIAAVFATFTATAVIGWQDVTGLREVLYISIYYLWLVLFVMVSCLVGRLLVRYVLVGPSATVQRPRILAWFIIDSITWGFWLLGCMFFSNTVHRAGGDAIREVIMVVGMGAMVLAEFWQLGEYLFGEPDTLRGYLRKMLRFSRAAVSLSRGQMQAALHDLANDDAGDAKAGERRTPKGKV